MAKKFSKYCFPNWWVTISIWMSINNKPSLIIMKPRILKILEFKLMPMDRCFCQTTAAVPGGAAQLVQESCDVTPPPCAATVVVWCVPSFSYAKCHNTAALPIAYHSNSYFLHNSNPTRQQPANIYCHQQTHRPGTGATVILSYKHSCYALSHNHTYQLA